MQWNTLSCETKNPVRVVTKKLYALICQAKHGYLGYGLTLLYSQLKVAQCLAMHNVLVWTKIDIEDTIS